MSLLGDSVNRGKRKGRGSRENPNPPVGARDLSDGSLDDRLHLVVIEGAQRGRPEVALYR